MVCFMISYGSLGNSQTSPVIVPKLRVGVFDVASSNDGDVQIQDFQCSWRNQALSIMSGVAVKIGRTTIVAINRTLFLNGTLD